MWVLYLSELYEDAASIASDEYWFRFDAEASTMALTKPDMDSLGKRNPNL